MPELQNIQQPLGNTFPVRLSSRRPALDTSAGFQMLQNLQAQNVDVFQLGSSRVDAIFLRDCGQWRQPEVVLVECKIHQPRPAVSTPSESAELRWLRDHR